MTKHTRAEAAAPKPKRTSRAPSAAESSAAHGSESLLQQRLIEAQAAIERDYTRLRELEARHRHLLDSAGPILVVEAEGLRIVDSNPAAAALLGLPATRLNGSPIGVAFDADGVDAIEALGRAIVRGSSGDTARLPAAEGRPRLVVSGWPFRQDGGIVLLLRLQPAEARPARADRDARDDARDELASYATGAPDGVVLTDLAGRILQANAAFVELVQLATERQVRGESLGRWLGRTSVDLGVLVTNLRQRGTLKLFSTSLRAEYGSVTEVEISAAHVSVGEHAFFGFTIRDVGRRLPGDTHARDDLSKSVGQLAELVGRVPLKEIVGNTAGLIEKMCIEAALQLTRDNRAAAAELLGLSRQSLYVKLRRYGMGDLDNEEAAEADGAT